jgi:hypothetical protein
MSLDDYVIVTRLCPFSKDKDILKGKCAGRGYFTYKAIYRMMISSVFLLKVIKTIISNGGKGDSSIFI